MNIIKFVAATLITVNVFASMYSAKSSEVSTIDTQRITAPDLSYQCDIVRREPGHEEKELRIPDLSSRKLPESIDTIVKKTFEAITMTLLDVQQAREETLQKEITIFEPVHANAAPALVKEIENSENPSG